MLVQCSQYLKTLYYKKKWDHGSFASLACKTFEMVSFNLSGLPGGGNGGTL